MFGPRSGAPRVMVRPGVTDMRKAINSQSVLVEHELELNPFEEGTVFLFCNRQRRILKALFWESTGLNSDIETANRSGFIQTF